MEKKKKIAIISSSIALLFILGISIPKIVHSSSSDSNDDIKKIADSLKDDGTEIADSSVPAGSVDTSEEQKDASSTKDALLASLNPNQSATNSTSKSTTTSLAANTSSNHSTASVNSSATTNTPSNVEQNTPVKPATPATPVVPTTPTTQNVPTAPAANPAPAVPTSISLSLLNNSSQSVLQNSSLGRTMGSSKLGSTLFGNSAVKMYSTNSSNLTLSSDLKTVILPKGTYEVYMDTDTLSSNAFVIALNGEVYTPSITPISSDHIFKGTITIANDNTSLSVINKDKLLSHVIYKLDLKITKIS